MLNIRLCTPGPFVHPCEATRVGVLFFDVPPDFVHQQTIQNIGGLVHGRRNAPGRERPELIGEMGVGLQARLGAVFGVDEVHRLSVMCRQEQLPVAGCGNATAPVPGHRWANRKAPNAGARSKCIVVAWDYPQDGIDHFETGLVGNTTVVRVARKPASKTNRYKT